MNRICICHESEKTGQTSVMCCNKCGLPDEDFWQTPTSPEEVSAEGMWKELRDKYFKECTNFHKGMNEMCKVDMNPHNLFEWFKKEFASLLKEKEDEIREWYNDAQQLQSQCDKYKALAEAAEKIITISEIVDCEGFDNYQQLKQSIQ